MKPSAPQVTVILPAYNEEASIAGNLEQLSRNLSEHFPSFEIIVVDDGSQDQTSARVTACCKSIPQNGSLVLVRTDKNEGKGNTVKRGVLQSQGDFILFIDADLPYDLEALERMVTILSSGTPSEHSGCTCLESDHSRYIPGVVARNGIIRPEVVVGSRNLPGSELCERPPLLRSLSSKIFSLFVQLLIIRGITDTQCGIKGFQQAAAREIFQRITIPGFSFDVELLFIAKKLGYTIQPIPVRLNSFRSDSRIHVLRDSFHMLLDLFKIRLNDWQGKYDHQDTPSRSRSTPEV